MSTLQGDTYTDAQLLRDAVEPLAQCCYTLDRPDAQARWFLDTATILTGRVNALTARREGEAMQLWLPVMQLLFAGIHAATTHLEAGGRFSAQPWVQEVRVRGKGRVSEVEE